MNLYQYAPNPLTWTDPLRLKGRKVLEGDGKTHDIKLRLTKGQYKETFRLISDTMKSRNQNIYTIARNRTSINRKNSLKDFEPKTGFDRDELPMAMFKEAGSGASVRYIDPSDNRGAGSSIAHALIKYPNGTRVKIEVID